MRTRLIWKGLMGEKLLMGKIIFVRSVQARTWIIAVYMEISIKTISVSIVVMLLFGFALERHIFVITVIAIIVRKRSALDLENVRLIMGIISLVRVGIILGVHFVCNKIVVGF